MYFKIYLQSFEILFDFYQSCFLWITAPAALPQAADTPLTHSPMLSKPFSHCPFSLEHVLLQYSLLAFLTPTPNSRHSSVFCAKWLLLFTFFFFFLLNEWPNKPRAVSSLAAIDRCLSIQSSVNSFNAHSTLLCDRNVAPRLTLPPPRCRGPQGDFACDKLSHFLFSHWWSLLQALRLSKPKGTAGLA